MKGLLRSRLVLVLATFIMSAATIAIPFSGKITQAQAAPLTVHTTLAAADSPQLIATLNDIQGGGSTAQNQVPAVALTLCVGYGFQNFSPPGTPLPLHPMPTTVGCDRAFFSGQSTSVDYTASNAPDFSAFVSLITNGIDDQIWTVGEALNSSNAVTLPDGGGAGPESSSLVGVAPKQGPDLIGFTIDFVRLVVTQVQVTSTPEPNGYVDNEAQWSVTWQFWGSPSSSKATRAIAWAESQLGSNKWNGLCEKFVENAYGTSGQYRTAQAAYNALHTSTSLSPDIGALVWFAPNPSNGFAGHVGIYIGNNQFISATYRGVAIKDMTSWSKNIAPYEGWGDAPASWPGR